jgi:hypothetical protein
MGCCMHPLHPQPCEDCLNTCYTNLQVNSCPCRPSLQSLPTTSSPIRGVNHSNPTLMLKPRLTPISVLSILVSHHDHHLQCDPILPITRWDYQLHPHYSIYRLLLPRVLNMTHTKPTTTIRTHPSHPNWPLPTPNPNTPPQTDS